MLGLRSLVRLSKIKTERERKKKKKKKERKKEKKNPCDFLIFPNLVFCSRPGDGTELVGGPATAGRRRVLWNPEISFLFSLVRVMVRF